MDDGPWRADRTYKGMRLEGLAPISDLVSKDIMWGISAEAATSAFLLREGLRGLDNYLGERQDFYPPVLQVLGQGFEHLMKLTLALARLRTVGALPSPAEMKPCSHGPGDRPTRDVHRAVGPHRRTTWRVASATPRRAPGPAFEAPGRGPGRPRPRESSDDAACLLAWT